MAPRARCVRGASPANPNPNPNPHPSPHPHPNPDPNPNPGPNPKQELLRMAPAHVLLSTEFDMMRWQHDAYAARLHRC